MINPKLMKLLEEKDVLDLITDSVTYQRQKIHNIERTTEGRDWHQELPQIVRTKFDNYKVDYDHLSRILKLEHEQLKNEMSKGYYYWRLIRSACNTYRNDLIEYDQELTQEFNFKETVAISENTVLNKCIEVLDHHVIES